MIIFVPYSFVGVAWGIFLVVFWGVVGWEAGNFLSSSGTLRFF
jgi:hypothetical protein